MADRPRIVGPDGNVPSSQRALHTAMTEKARVQMERACTEGRAAELIVAGVSAGINNIQEYFVKENARLFEELEQIAVERVMAEIPRLFEELEQIAVERVMAEIRRRSLRGRLEARWLVAKEYVRGWAIEFGLADPTAKPSHVKLEPPAADAAP